MGCGGNDNPYYPYSSNYGSNYGYNYGYRYPNQNYYQPDYYDPYSPRGRYVPMSPHYYGSDRSSYPFYRHQYSYYPRYPNAFRWLACLHPYEKWYVSILRNLSGSCYYPRSYRYYSSARYVDYALESYWGSQWASFDDNLAQAMASLPVEDRFDIGSKLDEAAELRKQGSQNVAEPLMAVLDRIARDGFARESSR